MTMLIMNKTDWIIAIANSDSDGVTIRRFFGTEDEVKSLLMGSDVLMLSLPTLITILIILQKNYQDFITMQKA